MAWQYPSYRGLNSRRHLKPAYYQTESVSSPSGCETYLMSERPDRDAERPRQSKVRELQEVVAAVNQQVLRLQVAVEHAVRVAVGDAPQNLVEEGLHGRGSIAWHYNLQFISRNYYS